MTAVLPGTPGHEGGTRIDPQAFRRVMREHAAGVAVITTFREEPLGFCATSLSSVSLDPPVVSFAVSLDSASGRAWALTGHGIVHLLRADQTDLAATFARSGAQKFGSVGWRRGPYGQPLLDSVLAWMLVTPRTRLTVGDHLLVLCDVRVPGAGTRPAAGPLVHHGGGFHGLPAATPA